MSEEAKGGLINVKDVAGLSQPLTKLIETVGAGFGRVSDGVSRVANAYWLASKDAENESQRVLLIERAKTQALAERASAMIALSNGSGPQLKTLDISSGEVSASFAEASTELAALQQRSNNFLAYQNLLHQLNREAILESAAAELAAEQQVSSEPVNQDWVNRFSRYSEDISTEDVQTLWGKILAGEVKQPGSFSLRTLDVLSNLSRQEAESFTKICSYIIEGRGQSHTSLFVYKGGAPFTNTFIWERIGYANILLLMECGLLQTDEKATYSIEFAVDDVVNAPFRVGSRVVLITGRNTRSGPLLFPVYNLTQAGNQLSALIAPHTPIDYAADFAKPFQAFGLKASHAEFSHWSPDNSLNVLATPVDLPGLHDAPFA